MYVFIYVKFKPLSNLILKIISEHEIKNHYNFSGTLIPIPYYLTGFFFFGNNLFIGLHTFTNINGDFSD